MNEVNTSRNVMRCWNCSEWTGSQFLFQSREDKINDRPGVIWWYCESCGEQWPA